MKDKALFLIYKSKKELSFSFRSKGGYTLLDWMEVEDEKTLKRNLRCIRRANNTNSYIRELTTNKTKEKWVYILRNSDGDEILRSRPYSSRQRCDEGLVNFIEQKKAAKECDVTERF
ncbi:hypothetical protein O3Q51_17465 [Cryomorphaceae bacterium 1068]|nr:hypothetical protein [Cryomorphaceae bacterium 1068]